MGRDFLLYRIFQETAQRKSADPMAFAMDRLAVGPTGSRGPDEDILRKVLSVRPLFKNDSRIRVGAFLTAYYFKKTTPGEEPVFKEAGFDPAAFQAPKSFLDFCAGYFDSAELKEGDVRIALEEFLKPRPAGFKAVFDMTRQLLAGRLSEEAAGIFVCAARLKLEGDIEYAAMRAAMQAGCHRVAPDSGAIVKAESSVQDAGAEAPGRIRILITEPFDGLLRNIYYSPAVATILSREFPRYQFVWTGPRHEVGPKYGLSILNVVEEFGRLLTSGGAGPAIDAASGELLTAAVEDFAPQVFGLRELREEVIKRSFISTLEKMLIPFPVDVLITSAFHGPYPEKMTRLGWQVPNLKACFVLRKGEEGSLNFRPGKTAEIYASYLKDSAPAQGEPPQNQADLEAAGRRFDREYIYAQADGGGVQITAVPLELPKAAGSGPANPRKSDDKLMEAAENARILAAIAHAWPERPSDRQVTDFDWEMTRATYRVLKSIVERLEAKTA